MRIACISDRDCRDDENCDLVRGRCERADACSLFFPSDVDCSTRDAPDGAMCAPVDELAQCALPVAASCEIVPSHVVVTDGRGAIAEVLALDDRGRPLPLAGTVTFPPLLDGVARCAGPAPCADVVTATVGDVSCEAPAVVLPNVVAAQTRVVVRDIDTGVPLPNARVVMDGGEAIITDANGVALFDAPLVRFVRAETNLYETVIVVAPATNDVEVLLPRAPALGSIAGKMFTPDTSAMPGVGDIRMGLGTLSAPDLVDSFDRRAVLGVFLDALVRIEGVTDPGGQLAPQLSSSTTTLLNTPVYEHGVALGRPGNRLLSHIGSRIPLSTLGAFINDFTQGDGDPDDDGDADTDTDGDGDLDEDDIRGPFDTVLSAAELGAVSLSFDIAGTVRPIERELTEDGLITDFDDGIVTTVRPALDASGEIDVVVPPLPAGDNAAFVSLHAFVPGRGFVLLAIRTMRDQNNDSFVDVPDTGAVDAGVVRLFVAPSMWTLDRELFVVAGSQRFTEQRNGVLARNRTITRVDRALFAGDDVVRVTLPSFRLDAAAVVEGGFVAVTDREDALLVVQGDDSTAVRPFRVLIGGDETLVDLAELGVDVSATSSVRVWLIESEPSFVAGTMDVARALAAPPSAHVVSD